MPCGRGPLPRGAGRFRRAEALWAGEYHDFRSQFVGLYGHSCRHQPDRIVAGFIAVFEMAHSQAAGSWTTGSPLDDDATSVTGFGFPFAALLPSHCRRRHFPGLPGGGALALYLPRSPGAWRWIYVVCAIAALELNVFVLIVNALKKVASAQGAGADAVRAAVPDRPGRRAGAVDCIAVSRCGNFVGRHGGVAVLPRFTRLSSPLSHNRRRSVITRGATRWERTMLHIARFAGCVAAVSFVGHGQPRRRTARAATSTRPTATATATWSPTRRPTRSNSSILRR